MGQGCTEGIETHEKNSSSVSHEQIQALQTFSIILTSGHSLRHSLRQVCDTLEPQCSELRGDNDRPMEKASAQDE